MASLPFIKTFAPSSVFSGILRSALRFKNSYTYIWTHYITGAAGDAAAARGARRENALFVWNFSRFYYFRGANRYAKIATLAFFAVNFYSAFLCHSIM
jgi:hypothetical protein